MGLFYLGTDYRGGQGGGQGGEQGSMVVRIVT